MRIKQLFAGFALLILLVACTAEPQPIEYGSDACAFCQMTIVDRQHAAEMVTKKGKAFKYDAIECMIRDLNRNHDISQVALLLITDFANAGHLIDAKKATYLISENIPSPMGANLSGFKDKSEAERVKNQEGGALFTWEQVLEKYK